MIFDVLTIFPRMFDGLLSHGMIKRAVEMGKAAINVHDLRDYSTGRHRKVDDRPYGGGPGMVLKPEPIFRAVETLLAGEPEEKRWIVLLSPQGRLFSQRAARRLAGMERLFLICGRYEGVDQRVADALASEEISIGDYVLTGGEIPAMVLIDAVVRLLPGVLGCRCSPEEESFERGLLDHAQYTRPPEFRGMRVPEVLLSGDHARIKKWREQTALEKTRRARPDLLEKHLKGAGSGAELNGV